MGLLPCRIPSIQGHRPRCCTVLNDPALNIMSIEEQSLRDLLSSPHAAACVRSLFNTIQKGEEVKIDLLDGTVLTLSSVLEAEQALQVWFHWPTKKDDR